MKVLYGGGLATHSGPESCVCIRKDVGEALTGGAASRDIEPRTQSRGSLQHALDRIRQAARRDKQQRFTALWHHVNDEGRLVKAYRGLNRKAAAGVDRVTWQEYGENLEENLEELSGRLKRGAYRARPVRRTYISKSDGRQRPLGVTALEDKIVQSATAEVLNAVYEQDFLGFSYGFRPGRSQHNALDAITVGIKKRKVNWVLDADVRGFFDAINHEWLVRFLEHRIGDQRVIRHVKKWLKAGVLEDGEVTWADDGTPQGGVISPLLLVLPHEEMLPGVEPVSAYSDECGHRFRRRRSLWGHGLSEGPG